VLGFGRLGNGDDDDAAAGESGICIALRQRTTGLGGVQIL
jgi:hypothetical protein